MSLILIYLKKKDVFYKTNFLTEKSLNVFLENSLKKRKNGNIKYENTYKNKIKPQKYAYFNIKLNNINIDFQELEKDKKQSSLLWVEDKILNFSKKINESIIKINSYKPKTLYRAYKGKIIINEIAKTYVFLSLIKNDFNCIEHFQKTAKYYKLYKKEICILPILVKYYFLCALSNNLNELKTIREKIIKFKSVKNFSNKNLNSNEAIYAIAKYNREFTRLKLKFDINPSESCYLVGAELLKKNEENNAILMWLDFL